MMSRRLKRRLFIGIAIAAVAVGGAVTAVAATVPGSAHKGRGAHAAAHRKGALALATAVSYLGLSAAQINSDLQSGQTLAQIANATSGKSAAGLIDALVTARKAKLTAAIEKLPQHVTAEVNRQTGPLSLGQASRHIPAPARANLRAGRGRLASAASRYLGISVRQLRSDLRSGKSLAQIADATAGKSEAGLIEALVTDRKEKLQAAVAAGTITQARENMALAKADARIKTLVNWTF